MKYRVNIAEKIELINESLIIALFYFDNINYTVVLIYSCKQFPLISAAFQSRKVQNGKCKIERQAEGF